MRRKRALLAGMRVLVLLKEHDVCVLICWSLQVLTAGQDGVAKLFDAHTGSCTLSGNARHSVGGVPPCVTPLHTSTNFFPNDSNGSFENFNNLIHVMRHMPQG